jgi:hypothetical protein
MTTFADNSLLGGLGRVEGLVMSLEEKKVSVEFSGETCKMVTFGYKTPFVGSSLPSEASDYHKAVFYSADLQQRVCLVAPGLSGRGAGGGP